MAAIDQRGKNSWRARVRLPGFGLKTRTFDTKAQAEVWAERIERELRAGQDTIPNVRAEPTLDEALERYEREITPDKKGHVQERRRIAAWRRHEFSKLNLSQLNSQHFRSFLDTRKGAGLAASTVRLDLSLISHLYTVARKEWGMPYLTNPIADVRQSSFDKWRDRRLSSEEFRRFEQAIGTCYNRVIPSVIRFALETAARKGELLRLTWDDVDLERRVMILRDTKNGDDRRVLLTQTRSVEPARRRESCSWLRAKLVHTSVDEPFSQRQLTRPGRPSTGKRQPDAFLRKRPRATAEYDFWAKKKGGCN